MIRRTVKRRVRLYNKVAQDRAKHKGVVQDG